MLVKRPKISEKTTFDDYLEEKEKNSKNTIPPPTTAFEGNKNDAQQSMTAPATVVPSAGQPVPRDKGQAVIMDDKPVAELPSKTVIPHDPVPGGGNTGGNEVEETETEFSKLETLRGDAYQHMLDVINKKFSYNSKSSPLYGILREQYEREAERASGRAYARATANAGGYGSSYATLAGEEAARQVMEGFDDNQMALYEAARDEFYSEQQSAVERYQLLDQMYKEQKALEEEEAAEADEQARIAAGGLSDKQYEAYTAAAQVWNGENKESVSAQLSRMPGMTAADVEAVMSALEADDDAVLADNVNSFKNAPTLSGAASLLATAKGRDNEAEITAEVQGSMKDAFTAALEDPTSAEVFSLLGMTEEQAAERFGGITDPDELASAKKAYVLDAAGQARVNGLLSGEDYMTLLKNDVSGELTAIDSGEYENSVGAFNDVCAGMKNYLNQGYISEEEYKTITDYMLGNFNLPKALGKDVDESGWGWLVGTAFIAYAGLQTLGGAKSIQVSNTMAHVTSDPRWKNIGISGVDRIKTNVSFAKANIDAMRDGGYEEFGEKFIQGMANTSGESVETVNKYYSSVFAQVLSIPVVGDAAANIFGIEDCSAEFQNVCADVWAKEFSEESKAIVNKILEGELKEMTSSPIEYIKANIEAWNDPQKVVERLKKRIQ